MYNKNKILKFPYTTLSTRIHSYSELSPNRVCHLYQSVGEATKVKMDESLYLQGKQDNNS